MANNSKQILSNLFSLLMEMNFHMDGPDLIKDLTDEEKVRVDRHYNHIKSLTAKYKAQANKQYFYKALEHIHELKNKEIKELRKLVTPNEQQELVTLFRKFDELTEKDRESILEDTELLSLIEHLKQLVDESEN